jgi:AcrR family transcriptional regulator
MKTKSAARRQAIVDAATELFRQTGFERTSMAEICARVGGSKATLYNYFPSKEELFLEVMVQSTHAQLRAILGALATTHVGIGDALRYFGEKLLALIYAPDLLALRRLAIAEATRSNFGEICHERGRKHGETLIAGFLRNAMDEGKLRQADPMIAVAHLLGLLESELFEYMHRHTTEPIAEQRIREVTARAVAVFLAAYGAEQNPSATR